MINNDKQNTEKEILIAAENEFLTKGYDGARTMTIAKNAGVTHAMLHYYFRTKELLFERIVADKFSSVKHIMLSALGDASLPLLDRIKSGITQHFDYMSQNPLLPRFIINEVVSHPERYEIMHKQLNFVVDNIYNDIQKQIDEAAQRGEMEQINAKMLFLSIMSLNIFTFVAYPFIEPLMGNLMADRNKFLEERKAENVETIMRRIRKQS